MLAKGFSWLVVGIIGLFWAPDGGVTARDVGQHRALSNHAPQGEARSAHPYLLASAGSDVSPPAPAEPAPTRSVEVDAAALIVQGDVPGARTAAIGQALRAAIERVAGVHLTSSLLTRNQAVVEDTVHLRASGFARLDQVLQEGADGDTYRVRVRVIVHLKRILEELRANGLGRQYRILVALPSPRVQGNDGSLTSEALIEDELARVLRDAGFTVLDWRSAAAKAGRPAVAPRARAPLAEVAAWGREHRADIVIRGWVSGPVDHPTLITRDWTGIDYVRFYLDAVVEAVRAETGEVVFSHSVRQPQEGVGRARAVLAALDLVSRRMGHRLVASLLRLPGARSSVVRVAVSGVASATDAQLLQDALAAAPAVRRATRAGFTEGILTVDLLVAADCADRMAAILEDAQALGDFRVQVESEGGGGIRARVVGAP